MLAPTRVFRQFEQYAKPVPGQTGAGFVVSGGVFALQRFYKMYRVDDAEAVGVGGGGVQQGLQHFLVCQGRPRQKGLFRAASIPESLGRPVLQAAGLSRRVRSKVEMLKVRRAEPAAAPCAVSASRQAARREKRFMKGPSPYKKVRSRWGRGS